MSKGAAKQSRAVLDETMRCGKPQKSYPAFSLLQDHYREKPRDVIQLITALCLMLRVSFITSAHHLSCTLSGWEIEAEIISVPQGWVVLGSGHGSCAVTPLCPPSFH